MGFMFAQTYHPAMKFAAPLRREIGIRTVFNVLGPLTNPAGAKRQVLGVASHEAQGRLAGALKLLGTERALVVHGAEGLDEISLSGPTYVLDVHDGDVGESVVRPEQYGLRPASSEEVKGGDAAANAEIIRGVLSDVGATDAQRDIVALNAAAALVAAGVAADMKAGLERAREVMASGAALRTLETFVKTTQELAG
jgi:anthranilate phosphoribosyltransferase